MKIAVIGSGYVGLVTGACFAELGTDTICVDKNAERIRTLRAGISPIYEQNLPDLLARNIENGRLKFTTDLNAAIQQAQVVFVCVNTPASSRDGSADLSDVFQVIREIASTITDYTVVVTKSTVPVGTGREISNLLATTLPREMFDVVSNPEFLSEGSAVTDFMHPNRIVVGVESSRAKSIISELYLPLTLGGSPVLFSNLETAELIKYAANAFLATKITFINEIADLCEQTGVDVRALAAGIGMDERIGELYLRPGPGYGGLCFPKDTLALIQTAKNAGSPIRIIETVADINEQRKIRMAHRVIRTLGGSVEGKSIAVLGLTFKPNTDDLRDSPSVAIIEELQRHGAKIRAHDPKGMKMARLQLSNVDYFDGPYSTVKDCDAAIIATAWPIYGELSLARLKELMGQPVIIDFHNMYEVEPMRNLGFEFYGIGQGQVETNRLDKMSESVQEQNFSLPRGAAYSDSTKYSKFEDKSTLH